MLRFWALLDLMSLPSLLNAYAASSSSSGSTSCVGGRTGGFARGAAMTAAMASEAKLALERDHSPS